MKQSYSKHWVASTQPRKQKKYQYNMPLHTRGTQLHVHLSPALRTRYGTRSLRARSGDKVKVLRGQFRGKEGKIERISTIYGTVFVSGVELAKKDGSKTKYPLNPSNLLLVELNLDDKKRGTKLKTLQDNQAKEQKK